MNWALLGHLFLAWFFSPEFASCRAAVSGDAPFPGQATGKFPRHLAVAWISDIHLQTHCFPGVHSTVGSGQQDINGCTPSDRLLHVETEPRLGRAGSPSTPRLLEESLRFVYGLVARSHFTGGEGESPAGLLDVAPAAMTAAEQYHLPPIQAILLTGDYAYSPKKNDQKLV